MLRRLRDQIMSGPASEFAADTAASIDTVHPDAVLADAELFGSVIAAQAAGLPVAVLMPNQWSVPTPGVGDRAVRTFVERVVKAGLADLNAARGERGLPPLPSFFDQILSADRILVLTSEAFDRASAFVPDNVRYVGPVLDDPAWVGSWSSPWPRDAAEPLVLVGLSSIYQNQGPLLQRTVDALSALPVRAVVTLGRMLEPDDVSPSPNVTVVRSAPHSVLLADASVVITACGHGTAMKTLAAGVPIVCIPMGRDQDTIARGLPSSEPESFCRPRLPPKRSGGPSSRCWGTRAIRPMLEGWHRRFPSSMRRSMSSSRWKIWWSSRSTAN